MDCAPSSAPSSRQPRGVIPAKAGIKRHEVPAFAERILGSRLHGNDVGQHRSHLC